MSETASDDTILRRVKRGFSRAGIELTSASVRRFPGEAIVIVEVQPADFDAGVKIANLLDVEIDGGFVTVKKSRDPTPRAGRERVTSLLDPRVNALIEVLNARSRTSEQQPSLRYIQDAAETLSVAMSRRHHLIFGRRGVGKTALMLEAKKRVEDEGAVAFWMNIQPMRSLSAFDAFLTTASRLCDLPAVTHSGRAKPALSITRAGDLSARILQLLGVTASKERGVNLLIPDIQQLLNLFCHEIQDGTYIFLDDIHYLSMKEQPLFLDMMHAVTRDNPVWLKIAGIKHQTRWFTDNPPIGLQTAHDAAIINLDVTLEQPARAREFLLNILRGYIDEARIGSVSGAISSQALDRLVLASGGVPRDFLILGATAVQVARRRPKAKTAGVQDVNEAAGQLSRTKLLELEDDAASSIGEPAARINALNSLRAFLLDEKKYTYFRVDFRDKEQCPREYDLLQSLMDLRLIHLINGGLSDERHAGRKSEVYMLDLSQYSGTRFKRNLRVLDFIRDHLVLKSTGGAELSRPGNTPNRLLGILRRGPLYELRAARET